MKPAWIIVLILVAIVVFGFRKLPDMAKSVGQALKVFKKEISELNEPADERKQHPNASEDENNSGNSPEQK